MHMGHLEHLLHFESDTTACPDVAVETIAMNTVSGVQEVGADGFALAQTFETRSETVLPHHEFLHTPEQISVDCIAENIVARARRSSGSLLNDNYAEPRKPRRSHKIHKVVVRTPLKCSRRR